MRNFAMLFSRLCCHVHGALWLSILLSPLFVSGYLNHDACEQDYHCLNGGKCTLDRTKTEYRFCECQQGFGGDRCDHHCPLTCQNGGHCHYATRVVAPKMNKQDMNPAQYACKCFGYYAGSVCQMPFVNCPRSNNPNTQRCYNGGTCVVENSSCECPRGYIGAACETAGFNDLVPDNQGGMNSLLMAVAAVFSILLAAILGWLIHRYRKRRQMSHLYSYQPQKEQQLRRYRMVVLEDTTTTWDESEDEQCSRTNRTISTAQSEKSYHQSIWSRWFGGGEGYGHFQDEDDHTHVPTGLEHEKLMRKANSRSRSKQAPKKHSRANRKPGWFAGSPKQYADLEEDDVVNSFHDTVSEVTDDSRM